MNYDKLTKTLRQHGVSCVRAHGRYCSICDEAATALSTLQAENAKLRESRDHWKRLAHELSEGVNGKDAEHERLQAENEKLCSEAEGMRSNWYKSVEEIQKLREELENYRKGNCSEGGCAAERDRDLVIAENERLRAELGQMKRDRDSIEQDFCAFAKQWWEGDSGFPCRWCKFENSGGCEWKAKQPNEEKICAGRAFEWRGQKEE